MKIVAPRQLKVKLMLFLGSVYHFGDAYRRQPSCHNE